MENRNICPFLLEDIKEKMLFLGGPRQIGKTTLAKELLTKEMEGYIYYNWDNLDHRQRVLKAKWPNDVELLIFDELHKYRRWKNFIKGQYDVLKDKYRFLVTGSARLDLYRKKNDSLQGRYHYYRLHPFTVVELTHQPLTSIL